jgi:hypothetical protein
MLTQSAILKFFVLVATIGFANSTQVQLPQPLTGKLCDCTGTNDTGKAGKNYICRDPRLGPKVLPRKFPLLSVVSDYDRFGGLSPGDFLKKWTNAQGYYVYPPKYGFLLNDAGEPILGNTTLPVGSKLDRFGSEYGMFTVNAGVPKLHPLKCFDHLDLQGTGSYVSAADAPYSQRALPPSNLDTDPSAPDYPYEYHVYTVIKPLDVEGGPIAPWFGQPGLGAQFYTGYTGNIMTLLSEGYIERVNKSAVDVGPGKDRCGE